MCITRTKEGLVESMKQISSGHLQYDNKKSTGKQKIRILNGIPDLPRFFLREKINFYLKAMIAQVWAVTSWWTTKVLQVDPKNPV